MIEAQLQHLENRIWHVSFDSVELLPHPPLLWLGELGISGQGLQKSTNAASEAADKSRQAATTERRGPVVASDMQIHPGHGEKLRVRHTATEEQAKMDTFYFLLWLAAL